jgi:hypothetical protein
MSMMVQIHDRVTNAHARKSILNLRQAIRIAEHEVPGLLNVLISEIVDSVEVSGDAGSIAYAPVAAVLTHHTNQPEPEQDLDQ